MLSRRDVVGRLAVSAAAVLAAGGAHAALKPRTGSEAGSSGGPDVGPAASVAEASASATDVAETHVSNMDAAIPATQTAPAPWELLTPLANGSAVSNGWRVAGLTGAVGGACVLTLRNERGRSHRVHVCRNDGTPRGLVYTRRLDLVVMNGGQGDLPTDEGFAQAIAEVAHVLAANEGERRHDALVTALLSQTERTRQHADGAGLR